MKLEAPNEFAYHLSGGAIRAAKYCSLPPIAVNQAKPEVFLSTVPIQSRRLPMIILHPDRSIQSGLVILCGSRRFSVVTLNLKEYISKHPRGADSAIY